tara:strand:+ start:166 stop:414 length:249 start_codon:yes stop_codon:yes gene_type:complete
MMDSSVSLFFKHCSNFIIRRKIFASTDPHRRKLYEGTFLNGKRHGQGRLVWECGAVYEGRWIQDRLEGYGILTWPSGMKYCG